MRNFLDAVLAFIGATSLTDAEYDALNFLNLEVAVYNEALYNELMKTLVARETVSTTRDRFRALFVAKGVSVPDVPATKSNVFLGSVL